MEDAFIDPIHLRRIDAAKNMRRFYELALQPTLFGDVSLVRTWGRIGTSGQRLIQTYNREEEAACAFVRLTAAKTRRGYSRTGAADDGVTQPRRCPDVGRTDRT